MKAFFPFSLYLFSCFGVVLLPEDSLAQGIDKRTWSLSTNFEVWNRDLQEDNSNSQSLRYSVSLQGNIFIAENLSAGIGIKREDWRYKAWPDGKSEEYSSNREMNTIYIHSGKYWFVTKSVGLYVQAGYGYGIGKEFSSGTDFSRTIWLNKHEFGIQPGVFVFPLKSLALEMNLGNLAVNRLAWRRQYQTKVYDENSYVFNLVPVLNIGLHYFIGER